MASNNRYRRQGHSAGPNGKGAMFFLLVIGGAFLFAMPALGLFVLAGLAPTLMAAFTDQGLNKALRINAIAAFNLAGVFPFALKIWKSGGSFAVMNDLLTDMFTWVAMYGSAAVGLAILFIAPGIAATILQGITNERLRKIEKIRRKLVEEWGQDIEREATGDGAGPIGQ